MWECCRCVQLNHSSNSSCTACGHKHCSYCSEIEIPSSIKKEGEKHYFFYLQKFFLNDKKIDPIEKAKLQDIQKDYGLSDKVILSILKLSSASKIVPFDIGIGSKKSSEPVKETPGESKIVRPAPHKERKPVTKRKSKKIFIVLIIILIIHLIPAFYIYVKKPAHLVSEISIGKDLRNIVFTKDGNHLLAHFKGYTRVWEVKTRKLILIESREATDYHSIRQMLLIIKPSSILNISHKQLKVHFFELNIPLFNARFLINGILAYFISEKTINGKTFTEIFVYNMTQKNPVFKRTFPGFYSGTTSDGSVVLTYTNNELTGWRVIHNLKTFGFKTDSFDTSAYSSVQNSENPFSILAQRNFKSISNDFKYAVYSIAKNNYRIDIKTGKIIQKYSRYPLDFLNKKLITAAFSPDGKTVALAFNGKIQIWKNVIDR